VTIAQRPDEAEYGDMPVFPHLRCFVEPETVGEAVKRLIPAALVFIGRYTAPP
jgi:hypothetical protein